MHGLRVACGVQDADDADKLSVTIEDASPAIAEPAVNVVHREGAPLVERATGNPARPELIGQRTRIAEVIDPFALCRCLTDTTPVAECLIGKQNGVIVAIVDAPHDPNGLAIDTDAASVETVRRAQHGMRTNNGPAAYAIAHGQANRAGMGIADRVAPTPTQRHDGTEHDGGDSHVRNPIPAEMHTRDRRAGRSDHGDASSVGSGGTGMLLPRRMPSSCRTRSRRRDVAAFSFCRESHKAL